MATIVVNRKLEFANHIRKMGIYINGEKKAQISSGERLEFDLSPGDYTVTAKLDIWKTPACKVILDNNLTVELELGSNFNEEKAYNILFPFIYPKKVLYLRERKEKAVDTNVEEPAPKIYSEKGLKKLQFVMDFSAPLSLLILPLLLNLAVILIVCLSFQAIMHLVGSIITYFLVIKGARPKMPKHFKTMVGIAFMLVPFLLQLDGDDAIVAYFVGVAYLLLSLLKQYTGEYLPASEIFKKSSQS